jgi:hypothetical protein
MRHVFVHSTCVLCSRMQRVFYYAERSQELNVPGSEFKVQASGFRGEGLESRVSG